MRTATQETFESICDWYLKSIITSPDYLNPNAVKSLDLLLPEFREDVQKCWTEFEEETGYLVYPVETFRSDIKQLQAFKTKASMIRSKGMHLYGIAVDVWFKKDGKVTDKGDYTLLRKLYANAGLIMLGNNDIGHCQYIQIPEQTELRRQVDYAIREFQTKYRLVRDGIVGPKTIAKAKEIYGKSS